MEGSYSTQNKTGKENNVQLLRAGGVLRELHCSTSTQGAQETQGRAALAGAGAGSGPGTGTAFGDEMGVRDC